MVIGTIMALTLAPLAILWILPVLSDIATFAIGSRSKADSEEARTYCGDTRLVFFVPAHNEELLIGAAVKSLVSMDRQLTANDVIVVADNCDDATAQIAAEAGAQVLERNDLLRRGKPYALEWAFSQVSLDDYDAAVIVDADTTVTPGFADAFARRAPLRDKAVQGYFAVADRGESWLSLLADLLAKVRYEGQYPFKQKAKLNCPLTGNGMCLGTGLLNRAGWAPSALTENWELYARYTMLGERIEYSQDALLHSQEASSISQSATQRRRWQAGKALVFSSYAPKLIRSRRVRFLQKMDALGELATPGPVVHFTIAVVLILSLILTSVGSAQAVAWLFILSLLPTVIWTMAILIKQPNKVQLFLAMLRLPAYAIWRVFVALLAIGTARSGGWYRSPRQNEKKD